jgi:Domain of unknown function (DUF4124)
MKRLSLAIALSLCLALPAMAQMYKWVDAKGEVHYSDLPPPSNVKTETLQMPAEPAAAPAAAPAASTGKAGVQKNAAVAGTQTNNEAKAGPKSLAEQDQAFRKRQADAAKAQAEQARKEAQARKKAEYCKSAKAALANLEMGGRQVRVNDKGERVFLTDEEIAQATAQARKDAAAACK